MKLEKVFHQVNFHKLQDLETFACRVQVCVLPNNHSRIVSKLTKFASFPYENFSNQIILKK